VSPSDDINARVARAAAEQERRGAAAKRRQKVQGRVARSAYSIASFAVEVDKDPATIWRWIKDGKIESVKFAGSTLIPASELDKVLRGGGPGKRTAARGASGKFVAKGGAAS
jgi:hypothetical protein